MCTSTWSKFSTWCCHDASTFTVDVFYAMFGFGAHVPVCLQGCKYNWSWLLQKPHRCVCVMCWDAIIVVQRSMIDNVKIYFVSHLYNLQFFSSESWCVHGNRRENRVSRNNMSYPFVYPQDNWFAIQPIDEHSRWLIQEPATITVSAYATVTCLKVCCQDEALTPPHNQISYFSKWACSLLIRNFLVGTGTWENSLFFSAKWAEPGLQRKIRNFLLRLSAEIILSHCFRKKAQTNLVRVQ